MAKRKPAVQTQGISDILNGAGTVGKYYGNKLIKANNSPSKIAKNAVKAANYVNPLNSKGLSKDVTDTFFAGKEIKRVVSGKGSKKDAAVIAGTTASWLVPFSKISQASKVVKVGKSVTRTSKVATKAARGAARTATAGAAFGGADYAANKATLATLNKVKPNKKPTVTTKPKTKKGK
jgi:hypothetical protein